MKLSIGAIGAFTAPLLALGAVVGVVQAIKRHHEESIQTVQANSDAYADSTESIESYREETEALIKSMESGKLSSEEMYESIKQLSEIEDELKSEFGSDATANMFTGDIAGLTLLTATLEDVATAYENLAIAKANQYLASNGQQIEAANVAMLSEQTYDIGGLNWNEMSNEAQNMLRDIAATHEGVKLDFKTDGTTGSQEAILRVTATAQDAIPIITALSTELQTLERVMAGDGIDMDEWLVAGKDVDVEFQNALNDANETISVYGKQYSEGINATITSTKEYSNVLDALTSAEEKYGNAIAGNFGNEQDRIWAMREARDAAYSAKDLYDSVKWDSAPEVKEYLREMYESANEYSKQLDFRINISASVNSGDVSDAAEGLLDDVQDKLSIFADESGKVWASDVLSAGINFDKLWNVPTFELTEFEKAYRELYTLFTSNGFDSVEAGLNALAEYGIIIGTNSKLIGDATKAYKNFTTESEAVNKVINEQNEGKSVSLETYEGLIKISDDYADCLEYQGDTIQFNTEKLKELNEARNNEQYATIKANKANLQSQYNKNAEEVYSLTEALRDASFARSADGEIAKDRLSQLLEENNALSDNINKLNLMVAAMREASSARAAWLNAQDDPQPGDSFSDASGAIAHIWEVLNGSSATRGDVGTSKYKTALDYVIPVDKIKEGDAAIRQYLRSLQEILKMDGKGNVTDIKMDNIIKKLSQGKDAILEKGDDGNWIVKAGTDIEDFAKKLGVTEEMARSIIGMMNRNGADLKLDDRETESYIDKLEKAKEAVESFKNRDNMTSVNIDIDFGDLETAEEKLSALEESLAQAEELAKKNPVGSADYESAADIISYLLEQKKKLEYPVVMSIDANQIENDEVKNAVEEFQNLIDLQSELEYANRTGDTVGAEKIKKDIETAVEAIKDLDPDILEAFGFNIDELVDTKSFEDAAELIESTLGSISENKVPDLASKLSIPESAFVGIQGIASTLEDMQGKTDVDVSIDCDSEPLQTALDYYNSLKNKTVYVNIVVTQSGGGRWFDGPGGGTWTGPVNAPVGTVNGTAHLHGTARASGDWGTAKAGRTLVGELGREIVVVRRHTVW